MPDPTAVDRAIDGASPGSFAESDPTVRQISADQRQSWLRGRRTLVENYVQRTPVLAADQSSLLALIASEFCLRQEIGENPSRDEYVRRFPELAEQIASRLPGLSGPGENAVRRGPTGTIIDREPDAGTQADAFESAHDSTMNSRGPDSGASTALIEASEALAREFAEREAVGQNRAPDRTTIVELLKDILNRPAGKDDERRPVRRLRAVPGYEIVSELGRGSVGVVYFARQIGLNRMVALKMILAGGHASRTTLARFRSEAAAVASLQHGNIVQIHEIGECDGLPFFSIEYCAGGSLSDRLNGTPLPAKTAARVVLKLAQAMHYAHGCKVIHRDLKPGNILLHPKEGSKPEGSPPANEPFDFDSVILKISDFGLAKRLDEASHTKTGAVLGTPSYMAPEQAAGRIHDVGPAADIYALGAILYELLTGRPPFRAATPLDTVVQVINDEPVPPRRLDSGIPADLETIALKCLEKEPDKRYLTGAALADDLQRFIDGTPILARPVSALGHTWRWCRRNPVLAALAAIAATSLVLGAVVSLFFANRASERADLASRNEWTARRNQYVAEMNLVQRAWRDVEMARVRDLLAKQIPATASTPDLRGLEWRYWDGLSRQDLATLPGHIDGSTCAAWSADGRCLATGGRDKLVSIWDAATGARVAELTGHTGEIAGLAFVGQRLISASTRIQQGDRGSFVAGAEIRLWNLATYAPIDDHIVPGDSEIRQLAVAPDGSRLALACQDGSVVIVRTGDWSVQTLSGAGSAALTVAFSADGQRLAAGFEDGLVRVIDAQAGTETVKFKRPQSVVYSVAWGPDGRRLAVSGESLEAGDREYRRGGEVLVYDWKSSRVVAASRSFSGAIFSVCFSPDGHKLLAGGNDRKLTLLDALSGCVLADFVGHEQAITGAIFSPNGRCLASTSRDGSVRIWSSDLCGPTRFDELAERPMTSFAMSADGALTAVGFAGGPKNVRSIAIYHLITEQPAATLTMNAATIDQLAFIGERGLAACIHTDKNNAVRVWRDWMGSADYFELPLNGFEVSAVRANSSGRRFAVAESVITRVGAEDRRRGRVTVFDVESRQPVQQIDSITGVVAAMEFDGQDQVVAVGIDGRRAFVVDVATGRERCSFSGHKSDVMGVALSPDRTAVATGAADNTVQLWDAHSGRLLTHPFRGHVDTVDSVAFSPDGQRIASVGRGFDSTTRIWDLDGNELLVLDSGGGEHSSVTFGDFGNRLAVLRGRLTIWDMRPQSEKLRTERAAIAAMRFHFNQPVDRLSAVRALTNDHTLSPAVKPYAIGLASNWQQSPDRFLLASWAASRSPYESAAARKHAVAWAEEYARSRPNRTEAVVCLGAAYFRSRHWSQAESLLRAGGTDKSLSADWDQSRKLFLAMTLAKLGRLPEAQSMITEMVPDRLPLALKPLYAEASDLTTGREP